MEKAFNIFDKIIRTILLLLCIGLVVVGSMQIIWRYALKESLMWSEEMIRFLFVFTTFIGAPVGVLEGKHAAVDLLIQTMPEKYKKKYTFIIHIFIGVVFAFLFIVGFKYAISSGNYTSPAMQIPMTYVLMAVPFGGAIGLIYWAKHMVDIVKGGVK